ncbi:MAG TPA: AIR synthase-related protein, partial [Thermoanaerobaculia bacterium]|nr:AIR synthase-related protein [Thermoanaerobaculia bacterium]
KVDVPLVGANLFSESQGRAIVACSPAALDRVLQAAEELGVAAREIGEVGGDTLDVCTAGERLVAPVAALHEIWSTALPKALGL